MSIEEGSEYFLTGFFPPEYDLPSLDVSREERTSYAVFSNFFYGLRALADHYPTHTPLGILVSTTQKALTQRETKPPEAVWDLPELVYTPLTRGHIQIRTTSNLY